MVRHDSRPPGEESLKIVPAKTTSGRSRDWLKVVVTPRARTKIRQWFTKERREEAIAEGKDALAKAIRRAGLPLQKILACDQLEEITTELKLPSLEVFYGSV